MIYMPAITRCWVSMAKVIKVGKLSPKIDENNFIIFEISGKLPGNIVESLQL